MNSVPTPAQKRYWFLVWLIIFLPLAALGVVITVFNVWGGIGYFAPVLSVLLFCLYWFPRFHKSLHYLISDEHVLVEKGVWWQRKTTIPFEKITNVDRTQNPFERIYGIGKVHCQTAGAGGSQGAKAEAVISGVKNLSEIQEELEQRIRGKVGRRTPARTEKDVLEKILVELKAIRQELKK